MSCCTLHACTCVFTWSDTASCVCPGSACSRVTVFSPASCRAHGATRRPDAGTRRRACWSAAAACALRLSQAARGTVGVSAAPRACCGSAHHPGHEFRVAVALAAADGILQRRPAAVVLGVQRSTRSQEQRGRVLHASHRGAVQRRGAIAITRVHVRASSQQDTNLRRHDSKPVTRAGQNVQRAGRACATRPLAAAECSGVRPAQSVACTSAPCAMSFCGRERVSARARQLLRSMTASRAFAMAGWSCPP